MRQQEPQTRLAPFAPAELAPPSLALEALQHARNAEGDERLKLAAKLNALLKRGPAGGDPETWGQFLIEKLDDEAFHDLYDDEGVSCRSLAVEAVLATGFPWALHIDPADLDYLRAVRPASGGQNGWRAMAVVTGVLAALFALAFFIHL